MEIKEGMYVRTNYGIAKITGIKKEVYYILDKPIVWDNMEGYEDYCTIRDIIGEPSYEIIKVLKPGDLVTLTNKYCEDEIYRVIEAYDDMAVVDCFGDGYMNIYNHDVESVVTKEQFEDMMYKVNHESTN